MPPRPSSRTTRYWPMRAGKLPTSPGRMGWVSDGAVMAWVRSLCPHWARDFGRGAAACGSRGTDADSQGISAEGYWSNEGRFPPCAVWNSFYRKANGGAAMIRRTAQGELTRRAISPRSRNGLSARGGGNHSVTQLSLAIPLGRSLRPLHLLELPASFRAGGPAGSRPAGLVARAAPPAARRTRFPPGPARGGALPGRRDRNHRQGGRGRQAVFHEAAQPLCQVIRATQ